MYNIVKQIKSGEAKDIAFGNCLWRVLTKTADRALLITEQIIDLREYNEKKVPVTYEESTKRNGKKRNEKVGVGEYQIWRMSEAYDSIRLSSNGMGLPIYVNGKEWSVKL
jgi:hypothetical protein